MMQEILETLRANEADLLEGASLDLVLPLREDIVNQVLEKEVVDREEIKAMRVFFDQGNRIRVKMKVKVPALLFRVNLPEKEISLAIESVRGIPGRPIIPLRITGGLNRLEKMMLQIFDSVLTRKFPKGIKLGDERIEVDLKAMLAPRDLDYAADYIQSLNLRTETGRMLVETSVEIPHADK